MNRISIIVPATAFVTAAADRDALITQIRAAYPGVWGFYHYSDFASGNENFGYYAVGYSFVDGVATVATVSLTGVGNPPTGSDLTPVVDPGFGIFTWTQIGAPFRINTSADNRGGGTAPAQNNNFWVWRLASNSPTLSSDFTQATLKLQEIIPAGGNWNLYKYQDSVSGGWAIYAIGVYMASTSQIPTVLMATCSGTPHPPTGSQLPAVTFPSFATSYTAISCPLSLGPSR